MISVGFEVYGRVQGVFFRKYTQKEAMKLGMRGWCMNTSWHRCRRSRRKPCGRRTNGGIIFPKLYKIKRDNVSQLDCLPSVKWWIFFFRSFIWMEKVAGNCW